MFRHIISKTVIANPIYYRKLYSDISKKQIINKSDTKPVLIVDNRSVNKKRFPDIKSDAKPVLIVDNRSVNKKRFHDIKSDDTDFYNNFMIIFIDFAYFLTMCFFGYVAIVCLLR